MNILFSTRKSFVCIENSGKKYQQFLILGHYNHSIIVPESEQNLITLIHNNTTFVYNKYWLNNNLSFNKNKFHLIKLYKSIISIM